MQYFLNKIPHIFFSLRHPLSVAMAVAAAMLFADSEWLPNELVSCKGWIVLAAFLVCQTTIGTSLRQGLSTFCVMIVAIFAVALLDQFNAMQAIYGILFILFSIGMCASVMMQLWGIFRTSWRFVFYFILMMFLLLPVYQDTQLEIMVLCKAIIIGSVIGLFFHVFLLPFASVSIVFQRSVSNILEAFVPYATALQINMERLAQLVSIEPGVSVEEPVNAEIQQETDRLLIEKKMKIQRLLQANHYPQWVFESGFNPQLALGFRFFISHLEQVINLYFAMGYSTLHIEKGSNFISEKWFNAIIEVMENNKKLVIGLIEYFQSHQFPDPLFDLTSDIAALEEALNEIIPEMSLLDFAPIYLHITLLVRDCKDSRALLLQLIDSLSA